MNGFFAIQAQLQHPFFNGSFDTSIPFEVILRDRHSSGEPWELVAHENVTWLAQCEVGKSECEFTTVFAASITRASDLNISMRSTTNICHIGNNFKGRIFLKILTSSMVLPDHIISLSLCEVISYLFLLSVAAVVVILQSGWQLGASCFRYFSFLICIISIVIWFYSFWCREMRWSQML